jgi:hypothetical protein
MYEKIDSDKGLHTKFLLSRSSVSAHQIALSVESISRTPARSCQDARVSATGIPNRCFSKQQMGIKEVLRVYLSLIFLF